MGMIDKIFVGIGADTSGLKSGLSSAASMLAGFGGQVGGLSKLLKVGLVGAIAGVGVASVVAFANFEEALTKSYAIMGDLSDEMKTKMSDAAREVAKVTLFSATETAGAYYDLASAGLNAAEAIEALPKVAQFAQAGLMDISSAAEYLTDVTAALGLKVDDTAQYMVNMQRVADVMTQANNMAAGSIEDFAAALSNKAAAALRVVNKEVEEGIAVLMVFAQQGVKGEEAGEKLYMVMRDLQRAALVSKDAFAKYNIAVYDASGNMRNMADIIGDLETATAGMSDETKKATLMELGFQERSLAGMLQLMGFSEQIRAFEGDMRSAGGATEEVAGKQLESFKAKLELLKGKVIDIGIDLGEKLVPALEKLLPAFEKAAGAVAWLIGAFANLPGGVQIGIAALATLLIASGPLMKLVALAANPVTITIAFVVVGLAAVVWAFDEFNKAAEGEKKALLDHVGVLEDLGGSAGHLRKTLEDLGYELNTYEKAWDHTNMFVSRTANEGFAKIIESGRKMGLNLQLIPSEIIIAWNSKAGYFKEAGKRGMINYLAGMNERAGYPPEKAREVATQIVEALGSADPEARKSGLRMIQEMLFGMVAQGKISLVEARRIADEIATELGLTEEKKSWILGSWGLLFSGLTKGFGDVKRAAEAAKFAMNDIHPTTSGQYGGTSGATPFQYGGIVTRPTLALIGEAGPEAVVPLSGSRAGAGLGVSFNNNTFNLPGIRDSREFEAWANRKAQLAVMEGATH